MSSHINGNCPYCKREVSFNWTELDIMGGKRSDLFYHHYKNEHSSWTILECPNCKNCVLVNCVKNSHANFQLKKIFPYPLPSKTDERIPEKIKNDIDEAKLCFSVRAFNGSASMSRRALQRACKEKGATKRDLIDQIEELAIGGVITTDLKELAQTVRLVGNDGAHPNDIDVEEQDAKEILELAEQFMEVIFVAPARVKEIKEKRDKNVK